MLSLSRVQVQKIAEAAGYYPARAPEPSHGGRLGFQRDLQQSITYSDLDPNKYSSLTEYLSDALPLAQEDVRGQSWLDITSFEATHLGDSIWQLLDTHGWKFRGKILHEHKPYMILTRPDYSEIKNSSYGFVNGPGLDQLRRRLHAREAAQKAHAYFGADPLSDATLERVKQQHNVLYKRYVRWGLIGFVFLVPPIVIGTQLPRLISESSEYLVDALVAFAVFAVPATICATIAARAQIRRIAAVRSYKDAYEYVLTHTFAAKDRPEPGSREDS